MRAGTWAMNAKNLLAALVVVGFFARSVDARATPDFPPAVDADLMLPSGWVETKVDSPDGCHLCHVNQQGGQPLTAFGTLMQDDGAVPYEAASTAASALAAIGTADPKAIADIKNGTDPNLDPTALSGDPVPEYGCGSVAPGAPPGRAGGVALGALALGFGLARRRRTGRDRPARR